MRALPVWSVFAASVALTFAACATESVTKPSPDAAVPAAVGSVDQPEAPAAEKRPVTIEQHGVTRVDEYAWLKDANWQSVLKDPSALDPAIRAHLEAEAAYYEASTADIADLRETIFEEMKGRVEQDASTVPAPDGPFAYYVRYREGGEYPIYARTPRDGGEETILFDGDAEKGDSAFFRISSVDHSPDHTRIAYGVDRLGSEYYTLKVRDLATGEDLSDTVENTDGEAFWAQDGQSFVYVERDENQRPQAVKLHRLGSDAASDVLLYNETDPGMFVGVYESQSGDYLFIWSGNAASSEVRYLKTADLSAAPVVVAPRLDDQLYDVDHRGENFYILTNADGAVDFKLMRAQIAAPGRENWVDVLAHKPGRYISGFTPYKDYFVRLEREDALPRIVISTWEGEEQTIAFDEGAYSLGLVGGYEFDTTTTRFTYESFSQPRQTIDFDMASGERTVRKVQKVPSGHDASLYAVERVWATAGDGARIPISVLRLKSTPLDGTAPLMLYGYGAYGAYIPANFSPNVLSIVDRGAVYALAHIRGGSAKGRQWYLDGKFDKKINTFTDFNAAADDLIEQGYADPDKIVAYGGSAGGLLVGAAMNLRPELYAGVVAAVPFVDVISTISDETLPLTPPEWEEWGDPIRSAEAYGWIAGYSPYDTIQDGADYPAVLATGGLTDYRVTYWEPAKWVARLRDRTTGGPILLKMNMAAGHGGSAARFERLEENAHLYAFALKVMGLADVAPVEHAGEAPTRRTLPQRLMDPLKRMRDAFGNRNAQGE